MSDKIKVSDNTSIGQDLQDSERLLGAVLEYLADDEVEVIDIDYLLENTEGLREWWNGYRERNRLKIEEEIKNSLNELTLEDLEEIREMIKGGKRVNHLS